MFGFLCQAAAVAFEASRLVMIQILLHGLKVCDRRDLLYPVTQAYRFCRWTLSCLSTTMRLSALP